MAKLNDRLYELISENDFSTVTKRIKEYKTSHPDAKIISLGIGDVSKPIIKPIIDEMHRAVDDLSDIKTFKGYGAYYGYDFLMEKILENDFKDFNFTKDEIYISNGTKTDSTSILELFDIDSKICITNPMYPIYRDGAVCLNRKTSELVLSEEEDFVPTVPDESYDLIYMCSPNNPMGIAYTYSDLQKWVDYALKNNSIILYDNVYESFITSNSTPHSIYEIPNAKKVAIEFRSFSKNASFTGVRCSYYIIPNEIEKDINRLWKERTINRFNGADYIAQKGAAAYYLAESQKLVKQNIKYYIDNATNLKAAFNELGFKTWGGIDSPFMWVKTKNNMSSWEFFDFMLENLNIIIIPGCVFGNFGDNYFRVSALGLSADVNDAIVRLKEYYEKSI